MVETITKITGGASVALLIVSIVMGAGIMGKENVYACMDKNIAMVCDKLSVANSSGQSNRCYFNQSRSYRTCGSGWVKFENSKTISLNNLSDYLCNNDTFIKECKNENGEIILRIKS